MPNNHDGNDQTLEQFRSFLYLLARSHLKPGLPHKIEASDVVQQTFLDACRNRLDFSPDGQSIVVGQRNDHVQIFDASTGKELVSWQDEQDRRTTHILDVAFSPDGALVATAGQDYVSLRDAATGEIAVRLRGPVRARRATYDMSFSVAFGPQGKTAGVQLRIVQRVSRLGYGDW